MDSYNMGTYKIPQKGMKIKLTQVVSLYQNLINSEVNNNLNVTKTKTGRIINIIHFKMIITFL